MCWQISQKRWWPFTWAPLVEWRKWHSFALQLGQPMATIHSGCAWIGKASRLSWTLYISRIDKWWCWWKAGGHNCWSCKQVGHLAKVCPQRMTYLVKWLGEAEINNTNNSTNTTDTTNDTIKDITSKTTDATNATPEETSN